MTEPTDLSHASFYRVYGSPSEENDILWMEIGRNGELCVQKENDDVKRVRFKFKNLQDFLFLLQRLSDATKQFVQSSTPTTNPSKGDAEFREDSGGGESQFEGSPDKEIRGSASKVNEQ